MVLDRLGVLNPSSTYSIFFCCCCCLFVFSLINVFLADWVFVAARGLSLVAVSRDYSSLQCAGFSLPWLLLLRSTGSRRVGFSSCGTQAQ